MAFTKIVGAGIHTLSNVHTHNINSSGIITATSFVGPFDGTTGDFSGNVTIDGNLVVNGDTTTLNTTLREVEILRVDANNSTVGAAITQSGSGDILNLYDGSTEVFSVADGGNVSINGVTTISHTGSNQLIIKDSDTSGTNSQQRISFRDSADTEMFFVGNNTTNSWLYLGSPSGQNNNIAFRVNGNDKFQVNGNGAEVVGSFYVPDSIIHVGDTNTKIRFPTNDQISFETGGSEQMKIAGVNITLGTNATTGHVLQIKNRNVDSQNTNALGLDIQGAWMRIGDGFAGGQTYSNGLGIKFHDSGVVHWSVGKISSSFYISNTSNSGTELFPSSRTDALVLSSTGNATFHDNVNVGGNLNVTGTTALSSTVTIPDSIVHDGDTNTKIRFPAADTFTVETNAAERLRINSTGDIGINFDGTPAATLDIRTDRDPANGMMCFLRNNAQNGNGAFYGVDTNSVGSFSFGIPDNTNAFVIVDGLGNSGTERFRITSAGLIRMGNGAEANTEAHITAAIFQNTSGAATILKLGNTNTPSSANNRAIEFCDGTGGTEGSSKYTYARIKAERAGGSNSGRLILSTKPDNSNGPQKAIEITPDGDVLIGNGGVTSQEGDGRLIVYANTRLHPAIKADCIDGGTNRANGFTMLADNYGADESLTNIGVSYSAGGLVLSRGVKVSNAADNVYLSSVDSFATKPTAFKLDSGGNFTFLNTDTSATTTTDSAVTLKERLRINSAGRIKINHNQTPGQLDDTWLSIYDANSDSSAHDPAGISKNYAMINLHNYGTGNPGDTSGIGFGAGAAFTYTKGSVAFQRTGSYGTGDLVFLTNNDQDSTLVNDTDEKMRITRDGKIKLFPLGDLGNGASGVPLYLQVSTNVTAINTPTGGSDQTGMFRIEDRGGNNNRFHGIELRNRNSGDIRILNKDIGTSNGASLVIAVDDNGQFSGSGTIRQYLEVNGQGQTRVITLSGSYHVVGSARDGSTSANAAASAWEIKKTLGPAAKTGYYYLKNPYDGTTSQWWCDMDTDGGGWVLIAHHGDGQMADQGTTGSHWWHRDNKGGFDTVGSGYKRGGGYWRQSNGAWGENTCGELMWDVRIHNVFGTNPSYGAYGITAASNHKVAFRWGTDQPLPTGNSNYTNIPNAGNRRFNEWCREVENAPGFNPGNYHQNVRSNIISGGNYFTEHMGITWCFRGTSGAADAGDSGPYWFIGQHANGLHQHYEEGLSGDVYGDGAVQLVSNQDTSWNSNPGGTNQGYLRLSKISDTGTVNIWLR